MCLPHTQLEDDKNRLFLHSIFSDTNDFTAIINQNVGPFSNAQRKQCFYVEITDDMTHEDSEHFFLNLTKHSRELQGVTIDLDVAEVTINDNDCKCNYHTVDHVLLWKQERYTQGHYTTVFL